MNRIIFHVLASILCWFSGTPYLPLHKAVSKHNKETV